MILLLKDIIAMIFVNISVNYSDAAKITMFKTRIESNYVWVRTYVYVFIFTHIHIICIYSDTYSAFHILRLWALCSHSCHRSYEFNESLENEAKTYTHTDTQT